ncbi:hypothetical protein fugu_011985 [Takifugu bimaculatus]|uniref:Uncharacterized protein n=2 Tax=Takifugu TaxID=31032 RepID=A0A4Z2C979_9TELE|nr:hypothetical protein fugu_011985 [Takifugu bimaculatus]
MYGHEDCVKALVYYDIQTCHLDLQNDKGDTALHTAARWGYEGIIQVLLENRANIHIVNKNKDSPLQCALNSKILMLLELSQNGSQRSNTRFTVSDDSSLCSSISSTSSLGSEFKPEGERVRHREVEKLLRAVADADVEMVRFLLEWTDEKEENEEEVQALLCHPLCQCPSCSPTHKMCVLQTGALAVNSCNFDGFTPLHVAALHGHSVLASLLIRHGANINARTSQSATPLHLASQNSHIQSNALVNVANLQGNTALHEAARRGHQVLVELLLRGGASPSLSNKSQKTPLDCAYEMGGKNTEILRALQKASGLSPDEEPIKLLSVPKGALAHSLIQRLQDHASSRRQKLVPPTNRILQTKKDYSSSSRSSKLNQGNPAHKRLAWGETLETAVDFGIREQPLARCHTLDPAEGPTDPTGQAPPGDPLPTTDATPTLPSQTLLHTCLLSADQSHEPSKNCLRPLGGQESHLKINGDSEPRLPAAQIHGGQRPGCYS